MDYQNEIGCVLYDYGDGLYANITNRCPCHCEFCIRDFTDGLGTADSLWLKREPSVEEVIEMLGQWDLSQYRELVFCGYGEPTERLDDLLQIAKYIKENTDLAVRINTNGLSDLINSEPTAHKLAGLVDCVSISLNESDERGYIDLCHPQYGTKAFQAILDYTDDVRQYVPDVRMSVVGGAISRETIERCEAIAFEHHVPLRVR